MCAGQAQQLTRRRQNRKLTDPRPGDLVGRLGRQIVGAIRIAERAEGEARCNAPDSSRTPGLNYKPNAIFLGKMAPRGLRLERVDEALHPSRTAVEEVEVGEFWHHQSVGRAAVVDAKRSRLVSCDETQKRITPRGKRERERRTYAGCCS